MATKEPVPAGTFVTTAVAALDDVDAPNTVEPKPLVAPLAAR